MLLEVQRGWQVAQAKKEPGVMETAMCHVVLLDAIVGSGLLDRLNHTQKSKCMMVGGRFVSEWCVCVCVVKSLQRRVFVCLCRCCCCCCRCKGISVY